MHTTTPRARALPKASALLLLLAVTTGWAASGPMANPAATGLTAQSSDGGIRAEHGLDASALRFAGPDERFGRASGATGGFASAIRYLEHQPEPSITAPVADARVEEPAAGTPASAKRSTATPSASRTVDKPDKPDKPLAESPTLSGRNRFWIPSLGISDPVRSYPCPWVRSPGNHMYRWSCAGENNVYILGHAYSVMEPLHDAYVRGKLRVGMVAAYAGDNGRVHTYRVTEWRVVDPTDSTWAIAAQAKPSMTLQTCLGKRSHWRLIVRLVAVD